MTNDVRDRKPPWWQLYTVAVVILGVLWLVEGSVPNAVARTVLEFATVSVLFALMLSWVRHHRLLMELDEQRRRRAYGVSRS